MKVSTKEFKKILFKTAFCSMACDGSIDDLEIKEMVYIDKNTSYFSKIDLSKELDKLIKKIKVSGKKVISELFEALRSKDLTIIQELLVLEVSMRIISSDGRHEKNELRFLNLLRSKLNVDNEIISDRFGDVPFLNKTNQENLKSNIQAQSNFIKSVNFPELNKIKDIKLN